MRRAMLAVAGVLGMACRTVSPVVTSIIPDEEFWLAYKVISVQELSQAWRTRSPSRYSAVEADFDGDGSIDKALLVQTTDGRRIAVALHLKPWPGWRLIGDSYPFAQVARIGIAEIAPGTYLTVCGKGLQCNPGDPEQITLTSPGLEIFAFESAASVVYWDEQSRSIMRAWTSD